MSQTDHRSLADRRRAVEILGGLGTACASTRLVAEGMELSLCSSHRWRRQFAGEGRGMDRCRGSHRRVAHRLSDEERHQFVASCHQPQFVAPLPGQIVPDLADRGKFLASVARFCQVQHAHRRAQRRGPLGRHMNPGRLQACVLMARL
jgi:putative transposase